MAGVTSTAVNIHAYVLFRPLFSVLLRGYLGVEFLGHLIILFNVVRNDVTVFHCGHPILVSSATDEGFHFSTSPPTLAAFRLLLQLVLSPS